MDQTRETEQVKEEAGQAKESAGGAVPHQRVLHAKSTDHVKESMADAILVLIKEKPIEKITVDELTRKAHVGRVTYFRCFKSKEEAITFKFVKMWQQYCELNDIPDRGEEGFCIDNAQRFFEFSNTIRHILSIVYRAGQLDAIHAAFARIVLALENRPEGSMPYREKFYAYGVLGLFDEWVKRGFTETPEEMAQMLKAFIVPQ